MCNAIYIVFSATPTAMGRLIRLATLNKYNHISFSFEEDIQKMYSFARYYQTVPLYGGFVVESILRYRSFSHVAQVKVCRLQVEEPYFTYLRNYLDRLWSDRDAYLYNTPSAVACLVHRSLTIPGAYTCATFIQNILVRVHLAGAETARPTVRDLEQLLSAYVVYEGSVLPMVDQGQWGEDAFQTRTSVPYAVFATARHFARLAKRVLLGAA